MSENGGEKRYTRDVLAQFIESIDRRLAVIEAATHGKADATEVTALSARVLTLETSMAEARALREQMVPEFHRVKGVVDASEDRIDRIEKAADHARERAETGTLDFRWKMTIGLSALFGLGGLIVSALSLAGGA